MPRPRRRFVARVTITWALILAPIVVLLAGAGFAALEHQVGSYWEGLWWALSLMTTVGFVGETPETTGGQLVSAFLMLSGFALLAIATAAVASLFVREDEEPFELREREFERAALDRLDELGARLAAIERSLAGEQPGPGGDPPAAA